MHLLRPATPLLAYPHSNVILDGEMKGKLGKVCRKYLPTVDLHLYKRRKKTGFKGWRLLLRQILNVDVREGCTRPDICRSSARVPFLSNAPAEMSISGIVDGTGSKQEVMYGYLGSGRRGISGGRSIKELQFSWCKDGYSQPV